MPLPSCNNIKIYNVHYYGLSCSVPVVVSARVVVADRVGAVVGDVLAGARGEHLQEGDLVGVGLVREVEPEVGDVREPDLPLARLDLSG